MLGPGTGLIFSGEFLIMANRDKVADQLNDFKKSQSRPERLTTGGGNPVSDKLNIETVGPRGPLLLRDVVFLDEMSHFDRERIPERVVHAKGSGAYGYFEVTHDITKYCKAKMFEHIGKKTPMFSRFSTVAGERGSADTARDPRGFALKFYTDEGIWDMAGNNTPIFFIRDAMLFPSFIHSQKRNPQTNTRDPDMFWDMITLRPECTHQTTFHYSDRGTPDGFRHMNGYGSHAYKFDNAQGEAFYVKFHFKTDQGIKNLPAEKAEQLMGSDPDYAGRDLFNAIANGQYPSWTMYIQVMTFREAENWRFNPFDLTKVWPHGEFPLIPVGRFTLNRNPKNYFAEVEQSAFNPSNLPPGIGASPDKMLQGRLFAYHDTHVHRLGTNYFQIPVNCPYQVRKRNYQRDGFMTLDDNQAGAPNYYPNSFSGPVEEKQPVEHRDTFVGDVARYNDTDQDNFTQTGNFWRNVLKPDERTRLVQNMAKHLVLTQDFIQKRAIRNFAGCDPEYGRRVEEELNKESRRLQQSSAHL